jgi:hypothetical protein
MTTSTKSQGKGIDNFTETISEEEMDQRLDAQHDEVVAMLEEGRAAIERGEVTPIPPLHEFLRAARTRFEAGQ